MRKISPEGSYRKPVWSRDGQQLVIHSSDNLTWLIDLETGRSDLLSASMTTWHSWSTDGRYLAGWDAVGVKLLDVETEEVRQVFDQAALPLFMAGGERLLVATDQEIVELNLETGAREVLLRVNGKSIVGFSLSGGGDELVLTLSEIEGSVWRLLDKSVY